MLDTNPVLKQERLSSTLTAKEDAQTNRNKEAHKSTIHVNPGSGHSGRHAQILSTVENRASSIDQLESIAPTRKDLISLEGKGCHQLAVPEEVELKVWTNDEK